ncbi:MAG: NAD(P)H-dependent oxidoreductase [Saprospiraceae bacterium]|nr:NAD(P)H-dependent oxidoreductase [Saprospiraceae bacterium]
MITVFTGTNRKNSRSLLIAQYIFNLLKKESNEEVRFFSLEDIPNDILHPEMYNSEGQSNALFAIQEEFLIPANKLFFVVPEYNGGFPGILKLFIDACSVNKYKESFHGGKKAALIGVSAGRSGGLRGLEALTGILNYLTISVLPNKLPVSSIEDQITNDQLTDIETIKVIQKQVRDFIKF